MRIAAITDLHYGLPTDLVERQGLIADVLLRRTVSHLNRLVHPDVVLVLGDALEDGTRPSAPRERSELRAILEDLQAPWLIIPGNHDGPTDSFYRDFPRPPDVVDIGGVRFLPFVDSQGPEHHARRCPADVARLRAARAGHDGPIVAFQHVCLYPPDYDAPYRYLNADDIVPVLDEADVTLSLSGHLHSGRPAYRRGRTTFVTAGALAEEPFPFTVIELGDDGVTAVPHPLVMPPELNLVDWHVHTQFAYCAEDMDIGRSVALARLFGLHGLGFAEHSGQLYFAADRYWGGHCLRTGLDDARPAENRVAAFLDATAPVRGEDVRVGLEVDCDYQGRPLLHPSDRAAADYLIGAVHDLPALHEPSSSTEALCREYRFQVESLLRSGIDILAHPFRVFRRARRTTPSELFRPVARLLKQNHSAAEINFHTNEPPVDFIRECLDQGVCLSFGSDAHNLAEIGDFALHLALLREAGHEGDPRDVLKPWEAGGKPCRVPANV